MDQIKFGLIRTVKEFEALKAYAKSFGHVVDDRSITPIYTIHRGDKQIGYFNLILQPIVCPSFHTELCTHRDFYDSVQYAKNHFCMNSIDDRFPNGTCFLALPRELAIKKDVVERMGFADTKTQLWQAIP